MNSKSEATFQHFLVAGGVAGMAVDTALFPLDTNKLDYKVLLVFVKSGGFKGVYSGLSTAVLGSAPTAAVFFCAYESTKKILNSTPFISAFQPGVHMISAATGEIMACIIRVPVEVIKQRQQAGVHSSSTHILRSILKSEGFIGLYRGYSTTVLREIPFSFIQFPLWEWSKKVWSRRQNRDVSPWQSSICGAVSGGIAAAVTTPLDVAKTRIILANKTCPDATGNFASVLRNVYIAQGVKGWFAGIVPRVMWISIGGAIFLGVYDKTLSAIS